MGSVIIISKWERLKHCLFRFRGHKRQDYYVQKNKVILGVKIQMKETRQISCSCGKVFYKSIK